jgi:DNA-directed RNA polymerase subunit RPC12/RpoP
MVTVIYRCQNCGKEFEIRIFEPGEAEEKRVPTRPASCPDCRSSKLLRLK